MYTQIIKRDGRLADFDATKIADAIYKAAQALGGSDREMAEELAKQVIDFINANSYEKAPTVEEVQNVVEKILIESGHARTAKEYILYRADRTRARDMNTKLMKVYENLTFMEASEVDIKRENANIDGDTAMGTMLKYGSEGAKQFYHMFVLDPLHSKAHTEGDIHIHDLDFLTLTTTCCQIDLDKLFTGGFSTGHGFLREPKDILTYAAQACIAIQSNQNDQHGGQSVPNFDYAMAKGVAKTYIKLFWANMAKILDIGSHVENADAVAVDLKAKLDGMGLVATAGGCDKFDEALAELIEEFAEGGAQVVATCRRYTFKETDKATLQAMKAFIHNLNTMHSRAGAQIPFSSINYGMDTTVEGRMVVKNLLLETDRGLGNGETPIFPIQIFKVKEGVNLNEGEPNYDLFKLACKVSAKRLFPNFSFIDAPFNKAYYEEGKPETEVAYMGCRTRVVANVHDTSRQTVFGRGNLSFTSINLPRLAIKANKNTDFFFEMLDKEIKLVSDQLLDRFKIQSDKKVKNYPFLMGQGIWMDSDNLGPEDTIGEVLKHGTLTIGFIGLAECLKALTGYHHGESVTSQKLGLEIIGFMRKRMDEYGQRTKLNFSLIGTPAEGLSGRFVKMDRDKYGEIEGITNREYYTNSFHVPVYHEISAFDKIKIEAPYHALTNAGHITYVELDGDPAQNLDAFEAVVKCMHEAGIGYGSVNHPVDRDPVCGYTGIIGNECPKCGRVEGDIPFDRIRRITGYLVGTLDRFNNAKRAEESERVKHGVEMESI